MVTLSKILDRLSDIGIENNAQSRDELLDDFWAYYQAQGRHTYHEITEYILKNMNEEKEGEAILVIEENLNSLLEYLKERFSCTDEINPYDCRKYSPPFICEEEQKVDDHYGCFDYKKLYKALFKLYDHIQLEFVRWSKVKSETNTIKSANRILKNQIEKTNEQYREINREYTGIASEFEDIKNQTHSIYMQMISILGIFAAIVIAVFGGLSVLNSISSAFLQGDITIYRTILVSSMCTLFVIWVIFSLLGMIRWFRFQASPTRFSIAGFIGINIVCLTGIIYSLLCSDTMA